MLENQQPISTSNFFDTLKTALKPLFPREKENIIVLPKKQGTTYKQNNADKNLFWARRLMFDICIFFRDRRKGIPSLGHVDTQALTSVLSMFSCSELPKVTKVPDASCISTNGQYLVSQRHF